MPIKEVLNDARVPVKIWTDDVESEARQQLYNVAALPFVFSHVAAMPDAHWGLGATVGSVIATRGAIVPAAVGVDIGCGMMAIQTDHPADRARERSVELRKNIEAAIPVGFEGNRRISRTADSWDGWGDGTPGIADVQLLRKARSQLGSLGSGNHFIEICHDEQDRIWLMLHSGSRNIGKVTAERHINEAKGLMKRLFVNLPDRDLAYFLEGTPEFDSYLHDLRWCQRFAAENRREMMRRLRAILEKTLGPYQTGLEVNCHHNYVEHERHFGEEVWVTRKGAVRAGTDDLGIIPGSMGARSYIVKGRGNPESFHSCAHGAGRRMGRKQAKRTFTLGDLARQTEGVECRKDKGVLDEIPGAYKDIDVVMANQADLVEVVATLKQIVCVKG